MVRPDPERPYARVLVVAMDMRQLELEHPETNSGFSCCYADGEDRKHDPGECFGVRAIAPERDKIKIGRIEHQFDSNQNQNGVAPD